jgi:hypothetical protein
VRQWSKKHPRGASIEELDKMITPQTPHLETKEICPKCNAKRHTLASHVASPVGRKYWYYMARSDGVPQPHVILHAGWKDTTSHPDDIGAELPRCRVFCHFGCSTLPLNQPVIRDQASWELEDDQHHAYFTTNLSDGIETVCWLYYLLSYDKYNALKPWQSSLAYALSNTNTYLDNAKCGFNIR